MIGCTETLTLVRHMAEENGDRYECVPVPGASWFRKRAIAISEEGAKPVSTCVCRIPEGVLPLSAEPRVEDFMVRGVVEAAEQAPQDFGGLDYMQITTVGDNRRGRLPHWSVSGV